MSEHLTSEQYEIFEKILRPHLRFLPADEALDPLVGLGELGLDSMASINLLFDLEQAFEISVPDEAIDEETFSTTGHTERLLARLLSVL